MLKKLIAPIVIIVLCSLILIGQIVFIVLVPLIPLAVKVIGAAIPLTGICVFVGVLIMRIKEIRSGEEDDLSNY